MQRLQYPYHSSWKAIVAIAVMFGACLALFAWKTATNDRGVIINHAIELGPRGATIFYGVLALASALFVAAALFLAFSRTKFEHHLLIDDRGLELPKSNWAQAHQLIAFADITSVEQVVMSGQHWIIVKHRGGKVNIDRNRLPNKAAFEEVAQALVSRTQR